MNAKVMRQPVTTRIGAEAGFTLIEILMVMFIVSLLVAIVAPDLFRQQAGAQRNAARIEISGLESTLQQYRLDLGEYPETLEGLTSNDSGRAAWNGPYIRGEVPRDPWGNDYVYDSDGRDFTLISHGADGQRGGDGDDADIVL